MKCQKDSFPDEISSLKKSDTVERNSRLAKLSPSLVEGVIRLRGRLETAEGLDEDQRRPVILDSKHPFTKSLVDHFHRINGHHGKEKVFNDLRRRYWILSMRAAVQASWARCQKCKNERAYPEIPEMAALPKCRTAAGKAPFTYTGLDYFGPLEVAVGRRREKRWVALFVCMSTRAIHVEIARKLDTDEAINCIRKFMSIRGQPSHIYSDNGTNFVGANRELNDAIKKLQQSKIGDYTAARGVQWHFNPPAAPHMGGSWERMVRSVKAALKETMKTRVPKEEILEVLLKEAADLVNGRPLTHVSVDSDDPVSITPNDILRPGARRVEALGVFEDSDLFRRRQWRHAQRLVELFWERWRKEYLPTLVKREKWHQTREPVAMGDVVIMMDDQQPRNSWPLGIVSAVFPAKDGQVRVVEVKTSNGMFKRPVKMLCRLDVRDKDSEASSKSGGSLSSSHAGA
jgi:hypothetical protein